jgi:hypothetical protein
VPIRQVKTFAKWGDCIFRLGLGDNPAYPNIGARDINFYAIGHPAQANQEGYIALLAADKNAGLLYAWLYFSFPIPLRGDLMAPTITNTTFSTSILHFSEYHNTCSSSMLLMTLRGVHSPIGKKAD